jgi:hypothetical protein
MFTIPEGDNRLRWIRIGVLTTAIGSQMNGISMIITGTSNFGNNAPGMDIIQVSTRGGLNFQVYTMIPAGQPETIYGWRVSGANTEIWIQEGVYSYEKNCIVNLARNGNAAAQVGILTTQYSAPSGFTPITIINRYALDFSTLWQGTASLTGGVSANTPVNIDISSANNCIRLASNGSNVYYRVVGNTEPRVRGKTFRFVNTGNADALFAVVSGGGLTSLMLVISSSRFADVYVDGTGALYYGV